MGYGVDGDGADHIFAFFATDRSGVPNMIKFDEGPQLMMHPGDMLVSFLHEGNGAIKDIRFLRCFASPIIIWSMVLSLFSRLGDCSGRTKAILAASHTRETQRK